MSDLKLSMSIERLPMTLDIPIKRRGLLVARICASDKRTGHANDVQLDAGRDDTFRHDHLSAMLRVFADIIDRKHGENKEAA
jgi:hypothetical protein